MKVTECMSRDVSYVSPDQPIHEAARMMLDSDTGALPVGSEERVEGMITDRDITVRAVAEQRSFDTPVRDVMTNDVVAAFEDQDIDDVALIMSDLQVRRLPVLSRDQRLIGIVSLADLARSEDASTAEAALSGIAEPGGSHNQGADISAAS